MAEALASHLELARACERPAALKAGFNLYPPDRLWPARAHSPIFDFDATAGGAEWIDAIAARAKPLATVPSTTVLGHTDWSGKHFRFDGEQVSIVYDWDSLRLISEAQIVGTACMTFTTNFELPGVKLTPSPDEARAFVDEYSAARETRLTRSEREHIAACATFIAAYTARCEHCLEPDAGENPNTFTWALRAHGEDYLQA